MRQFVSAEFPDKDGILKVSGKDFRYLCQVLRLRTGDMTALRLPDGSLVNSTVAKIDEGSRIVCFQVCGGNGNFSENQSEYSGQTEFYLFQFVAKSAKMELIVRQATECGVAKSIAVEGEVSEKGCAKKNFKNDRTLRIIKEARQQSGSPVQTEICETVSFKQALNLWKEISSGRNDVFGCVFYERSCMTESLHKSVGEFKEINKCVIFSGGEGGISPAEIQEFAAEKIVPVHFDTNILRCETAALYGIAALQSSIAEKNLWTLKE